MVKQHIIIFYALLQNVMLSEKLLGQEFILIKPHNIPYLIHSYCYIQNKEGFINNNSYT